ncbi:MAG: adenosylcobinamide-GDP ribazoletransferase [Pseudomonadota bacterium]
MTEEVNRFLLALQFLTRIPMHTDGVYSPERMATSARYYPLVGFLIGAISGVTLLMTALALPGFVAVILATAVGLLLTGAFHEDGLADTFDGIGGGMTREKSLAIMRDSRLGTYGTLSLIIALALKVGALSSLPTVTAACALALAHCLSRLSSVLVIRTSRYVRDEGTGKPVADGLDAASLVIAIGIGVAASLLWLGIQPVGALLSAFAGLGIGHIGMRLFFEPKLRGYTGDTLGAVQQTSEISMYLGLAVWF